MPETMVMNTIEFSFSLSNCMWGMNTMQRKKHMKRSLITCLFLFTFCVSAHAAEVFSPHNVSITISPFHLLNPELHLTGELRLAPKMSAAVMLGAGRITDEGKRSGIWEVGGQFRYYLLGSFTHGMMLGVDAGYIDVDAQIENPIEYLVGTHAGGFLGYKFSMKNGFTTEIQLGPIYLWGENPETSESQTLEAFKVGWSF
jgi:hypothetical protein